MIRVVLVDDDSMVRAHLRTILESDDDITVVGEAADGAAAVEAAVRLAPDVILMDLRMPGVNGVVATERITSLRLKTAVVALTTFDADTTVQAALQAGASGFLLKSTPPADLVSLVRVAAAGHTVLSAEATARLVRRPSAEQKAARLAIGRLTAREREVLALIAAGKSNAAIGRDLSLSEPTVKGYVSAILDKLGCQNRTQAGLLGHQYLA